MHIKGEKFIAMFLQQTHMVRCIVIFQNVWKVHSVTGCQWVVVAVNDVLHSEQFVLKCSTTIRITSSSVAFLWMLVLEPTEQPSCVLLEWKEFVVFISCWFWMCPLRRARQMLQHFADDETQTLRHKPQSSNLTPVCVLSYSNFWAVTKYNIDMYMVGVDGYDVRLFIVLCTSADFFLQSSLYYITL